MNSHISFHRVCLAICLLFMVAACASIAPQVDIKPVPSSTRGETRASAESIAGVASTASVTPAPSRTPGTISSLSATPTFGAVPSSSATLLPSLTATLQAVVQATVGPSPTRTALPVVPTLTASLSQPIPPPDLPAVQALAVVPTTTHALGEWITVTWQARGSQVLLCPYVLASTGPVPELTACLDVALAGSRAITITRDDLDWDGIMVRVTTQAASAQAFVPLTLGCQGLFDWFFPAAPSRCPQSAPISTRAAAQRFEHGLMIWLEQPDRFYVFFDETPRTFEWVDAPYHLSPNASPNNRVGAVPPAGLYEPVSGFGQLWRGEFEGLRDVRGRLGWAREAEFSFSAHYQCARPRASGRLWTCYLSVPGGRVRVLRPDSTAQVRFVWDEP